MQYDTDGPVTAWTWAGAIVEIVILAALAYRFLVWLF